MLTLFTIPKAFEGHNGVIQSNAIRSWTLLRPACEIILFGKDKGTAGIAAELGLRHVPDVECNEYGTPLMSSVFSIAHNIAKHQLMCFINSDIILLSDFLPAVQRVKQDRFLMVGLRWDLDLAEAIDFTDANWEQGLRKDLTARGKLHARGSGGDYFLFSRGLFEKIPSFAIGRGGWDNWLIYRARALGAPVIEATTAFVNVHQNHDYSHVRVREGRLWEGPESQRNGELMVNVNRAFIMDHATHLLTPDGLKRALTPRRIYFQMRAMPVIHPQLGFLLPPFKAFEALIRAAKGKR